MSLEAAVSKPSNMIDLEIALREARRRRLKEKLIEKFFFLNGLTAILVLGGIFTLLFLKSYPAIEELGLFQFFLVPCGIPPPMPPPNTGSCP